MYNDFKETGSTWDQEIDDIWAYLQLNMLLSFTLWNLFHWSSPLIIVSNPKGFLGRCYPSLFWERKPRHCMVKKWVGKVRKGEHIFFSVLLAHNNICWRIEWTIERMNIAYRTCELSISVFFGRISKDWKGIRSLN